MTSLNQAQSERDVITIHGKLELASASTVIFPTAVTAHTKPTHPDTDITVESYLQALLQHSCREQHLEEELLSSYRRTERLYTQLAEIRSAVGETALLLFKIPMAIADGATRTQTVEGVEAAWEALKRACV